MECVTPEHKRAAHLVGGWPGLGLIPCCQGNRPGRPEVRAMAYGPRPADLSNLLASKRFTIIHVACPNRRIGQTDYILLNSSRIIGGSHPAVADIPIGT